MMANARREVMISSSMVSSGTRLSASRELPGSGRSPGREADAPLSSTCRNPTTMPRCQAWAPEVSPCIRSRRRWNSVCSEGLSSCVRAASMTACTSGVRPLTSSSEYSRRAWVAMASGEALVPMSVPPGRKALSAPFGGNERKQTWGLHPM